MYQDLTKLYDALSKSKFRSSFHLKSKDIEYINKIGMDKIKDHTKDFIIDRLFSLKENDGKQTPYRGHPTFIAMHACGCCCRGCLYKWHKIPKEKTLSNEEIEYIEKVLIAWIENEYKKNSV